jgi:hypothetical protein
MNSLVKSLYDLRRLLPEDQETVDIQIRENFVLFVRESKPDKVLNSGESQIYSEAQDLLSQVRNNSSKNISITGIYLQPNTIHLRMDVHTKFFLKRLIESYLFTGSPPVTIEKIQVKMTNNRLHKFKVRFEKNNTLSDEDYAKINLPIQLIQDTDETEIKLMTIPDWMEDICKVVNAQILQCQPLPSEKASSITHHHYLYSQDTRDTKEVYGLELSGWSSGSTK